MSFAGFLEEGRRSVLPCVICGGLAAQSRHLFTPPGTRPAKTAGVVWEKCGVEMGRIWGRMLEGGMGLQMSGSRRQGRVGGKDRVDCEKNY